MQVFYVVVLIILNQYSGGDLIALLIRTWKISMLQSYNANFCIQILTSDC